MSKYNKKNMHTPKGIDSITFLLHRRGFLILQFQGGFKIKIWSIIIYSEQLLQIIYFYFQHQI